MHFYKYIYELDFTSVELSKCNNNIASVEPINQEQRVLGNATFEPSRSVFNLTYVFNSWLASGRSRTKCFPAEGGGFQVRFSCPVMLHGEYGGEEGKPVSTDENLLYEHDHVFDACKQQGLIASI